MDINFSLVRHFLRQTRGNARQLINRSLKAFASYKSERDKRTG
jgi:hypothetical protein